MSDPTKFFDLKLTAAGEALNAKIQQGLGTIPLTITRIVTSSGYSDNPLELKAVSDERQTFEILSRERIGARVIFNTFLANYGNPAAEIPPLAQGYPLWQIGFYAIDPDEGEILYRLSQFENPNWVPALNERGWEFSPKFNFSVGNASDVHIVIDPSGVTAAMIQVLEEHKAQTATDGVHGFIVKDGVLLVRDGDNYVSVGGSGDGESSGDLAAAIANHNVDPKAHEELFVTIDGLAVGEHNQDPKAHEELFMGLQASIDATQEDAGTNKKRLDEVAEAIAGHKDDPKAHGELFAQLQTSIDTAHEARFAAMQASIDATQEGTNTHMDTMNAHIHTSTAHGWRFNAETGNMQFFNPITGEFQNFVPPREYKTYGVQIDANNSNPYSAVTYIGDATGMVGGSALWDSMPIFEDIRPCLFNNGKVVGYLNPNNYAQWAEGQGLSGVPDISSGSAGDVMVEFPKVGWRINTVGNTLTVEVTNDPNAGVQGFRYYAHTRQTEGDRDYLYVGAYKGHVLNNRLRSISNWIPTARTTIAALRTAAQLNGTGYDQQMFYPLMLLQILYLIRFKNLNSQAALGQGVTASGEGVVWWSVGIGNPPDVLPPIDGLPLLDDSTANLLPAGVTNTQGMNWGSQNPREQVKFLGIEDLWGNIWERVDGCWIDANHNLCTAFQNFNDTGAGYVNRGSTGTTASISDWIRTVQGNSEMGFLIRTGGGSATTFFADWGNVAALRLGFFGGGWANGDQAGIFRFSWLSADDNSSFAGGRLLFL